MTYSTLVPDDYLLPIYHGDFSGRDTILGLSAPPSSSMSALPPRAAFELLDSEAARRYEAVLAADSEAQNAHDALAVDWARLMAESGTKSGEAMLAKALKGYPEAFARAHSRAMAAVSAVAEFTAWCLSPESGLAEAVERLMDDYAAEAERLLDKGIAAYESGRRGSASDILEEADAILEDNWRPARALASWLRSGQYIHSSGLMPADVAVARYELLCLVDPKTAFYNGPPGGGSRAPRWTPASLDSADIAKATRLLHGELHEGARR